MTHIDKLLTLRANMDTVIAEVARIHNGMTGGQRYDYDIFNVGIMLAHLRDDLTELIRESSGKGTGND